MLITPKMSFNGNVGTLGSGPSKVYLDVKVTLDGNSEEKLEGIRSRLRLKGMEIMSDSLTEKDGKYEYAARVSSERGF